MSNTNKFFIASQRCAVALSATIACAFALTTNAPSLAQDLQTAIAANAVIANGEYRLRNACAGKLLGIRNAPINPWGDVVVQPEDSTLAITWQVTAAGNGSFNLRAAGTNSALQTSFGRTENETNVDLWTYGNANSQRWIISDAGNGYSKLNLVAAPDKALDLKAGGANGEANVWLYTNNSSCAQQWKLEEKSQPPVATGKTLYVAVNGADSNAGTPASPFATVQKAVDLVRPGETVFVNAGTYDVGAGVRVNNKRGTALQPITLQGAPGATLRDVSRRVLGAAGAIIAITNSSHVQVKGLRVENSSLFGISAEDADNILIEGNTSAISLASGIFVNRAKNVTVRKNDLSRFCDGGQVVDQYNNCQEGLSISNVDTFDVAENIVHDAPQKPGIGPGGGEGIDTKQNSKNGTVRYNRVYNLPQGGIYIDAFEGQLENIQVYGNIVYNTTSGITVAAEVRTGSAKNIDIYNNVVYNNGITGIAVSGYGIAGDSQVGVRQNIRIFHNTAVNNGYSRYKAPWDQPNSDYGFGIFIDGIRVSDVLVANNIVANNSLAQIAKSPTAPGAAITTDRNIVFPSAGDFGANTIVGANVLIVDPRFVNIAQNDFRLTANSPAIATSVATGPRPSIDITGKPRAATGPLDLGAYRFAR
jgi:Right handed beta helix region/Ricin-type beta-trefoil lectin domain-like